MTSTISFYGGWAGLAVIGAGYWYLQKRKSSSKPARATVLKQPARVADIRKETKSKKSGTDAGQSGIDQDDESQDKVARKSRKRNVRKIESNDAKGTTSTGEELANDNLLDDELDNEEFARQLQNAKSGTIKPSQSSAGSRQKTLKHSQANNASSSELKTVPNIVNGSDNFSPPSSTAGADGDDDLSATNSPQLGATSMNTLGRADVSDMLEPAGPGPAILRITEPTTSQPKKERKPAAVIETLETKKQRQNRKKAEAKKVAREEDEQERRILMEKQRRIARQAEGRAAKDGSAFMAAAAPTASVWAATKTKSDALNGASNDKIQMLDTFEPTAEADMSGSKSAKQAKSKDNWNASLPSEEEQIRILKEDAEWNTVQGKKGKKKAPEQGAATGLPTNGLRSNETLSTEKTPTTDKKEVNLTDRSVPLAKKHETVTAYRDDHGVDVEETAALEDSEWEVA